MAMEAGECCTAPVNYEKIIEIVLTMRYLTETGSVATLREKGSH